MRASIDETMMGVARVMSARSTCLRRQVGCVLVNKRNHVLATGYNGVAAGTPHCNEVGKISKVSLDVEEVHPYQCEGAYAKSGEALDKCQAIHAEQNALLQCKDVYEIEAVYTTTFPCIHCMKLLMNTSCKIIYYQDDYADSINLQIMWAESLPETEQRKLQRWCVRL